MSSPFRRYRWAALFMMTLTAMGSVQTARAADVEYRRGLHEGFERIVFDWPQAVEHELQFEDNRATIKFSTAGQFVPSGGAKGTGELLQAVRILDAQTVELIVHPNARLVELNLDGRTIGYDIVAGQSNEKPSTTTTPAAMNEGYRRDLMIQSLLARIEALEGMAPAAGPASAVAGSSEQPQNSQSTSLRQDLLIDRALERTLASDGTLLLAQGDVEIEPSLSYALADDSTPVFITDLDDVSLFVGANEQRRQSVVAGLAVRAGLPYDTQIEAQIPWLWADERLVTEVGNAGAAERSDNGKGIGDIRLGLAKTLFRSADNLPDIVGRLFWDTATGERADGNVALGGGRHEFGVSLSALKRQDPLAFSAAVSAETSLKDNGIKRGDRFGVGLSTILAASPHTSLRIGYSHRFEAKSEIRGNKVAGSGRSFGTLSLGGAAIVAKRTLLDFTIGVGLGNDAPDVTARLAVPMRFSVK